MVRMGFFSGSANRDQRLAKVGGASQPVRIDTVTTGDGRTFKRVLPDFGVGRIGEIRLKKAEADFVSPRGKEVARLASLDPTQNIQPQPLSPIGSPAYEKELEGFKKEMKDTYNYRTTYDLDTGEEIDKYFRKVPGGRVYGDKEMERDYPIFRQYRYERNPLNYQEGVPFGKTEEKGNALQRIAGSIFDAVTGTQPVAADVLDGRINFNDAVRRIGNLPSDYKATEEAAFRAAEKFRDTVSGMSNLPSDYKATEAAAFRSARNFKEAQAIAKRNPNVSINSDGKAVATNNSAKARAQAAAVNRKLSGKSMSQVKSENKQAMKDRAKARHAAFKKKRAEKKKNKKK